MSEYAVIKNDAVINAVIADNKATVEALNPDATVVEITPTNNLGVGWFKLDGQWVSPKPFESWVRRDNRWNAPIDPPDQEKNYVWDESVLGWAEVTLP